MFIHNLSLEAYILIFSLLGILITFIWALIFLYKPCPSNKVLVKFGKMSGNSFVKCYHGGGAIVWPIIQGYRFLDLTPKTIHIGLKSALSLQNIRINVPSTFTIAIDVTNESMNNAAIRLLDLTSKEIELMAEEIITGQMRLTVASLTIEQINQDRESFLSAIKNHVDPELKKVGLILVNVNITDITDESHYIDSIGKKAASLAVNQAKIDVAEADKRGEIGQASAQREQRISVAAYNASAVEGENEAKAKIVFLNADLAEKTAQAKAQAEVAEQKSHVLIQEEKAKSELRRLEALEIIPKEIEKSKTIINSQAEAEKIRLAAQAESEAILVIKKAEAQGIKEVLEAKALGYEMLLKACNNDSQVASNMLMIEKLEKIASLQAEAIKNIKIDKITVWDNPSDKSSSTANFMSNLIKSLPAMHDIASMAGLDLPEYLGKVKVDDTSKQENK